MPPRRVDVHTVRLDFGWFSLTDGTAVDPMPVLDPAIEGDGIAQGAGLLVVLSPHQNNFAMRLAVEHWDAEPPDDVDAWQEAFAADLAVGARGVSYESPTLTPQRLDIDPGAYEIRICGRGFVARGWPGPDPADEWRLQLWPADPAQPPGRPRRLAAWTGP